MELLQAGHSARGMSNQPEHAVYRYVSTPGSGCFSWAGLPRES